MSAVRAERRRADRKSLEIVIATELTSLNRYELLAKEGIIKDASTKGFLLVVDRKYLVPTALKDTLNLDRLIGDHVVMYLPQMNLDLDGTICRAVHKGKGMFEIAINFSDEVPEYWRECLIDLLPAPGEITSE